MNFKLAASAAVLALAILAGCAADSEESATTDSDLVAPMPSVQVQGAWRAKPGTATSPSWFEGVVFSENGTFFADVNNGIMCITTPCPSSVRISGTYTVRGQSLLLTSTDPANDSQYFARYSVSRSNDDQLTIKGAGFANTLETQHSYCGEPTDCAGQGLIHPMCVGHWTCSEQNSCGYSCGIDPAANTVWPTDRTKLVAETKGGGFKPPPPPGSTCALGAAKYTLDLATKTLSWEVCDLVDWNTPLTKVTGSRAAVPADIAKINAAMRTVKITNEEICGADKPMLNLFVTSASQGTKTYTDSFYSCIGGGRTFVDNIDEVFGAFRTVTGH